MATAMTGSGEFQRAESGFFRSCESGGYLYSADVNYPADLIKSDLTTHQRVAAIALRDENPDYHHCWDIVTAGGYLYLSVHNADTTVHNIVKVDISTFTVVDSLALSSSTWFSRLIVNGTTLYVTATNGDDAATVFEIDLTTFTETDSLVLDANEAAWDGVLVGTTLYLSTRQAPARVVRVDTTTLTRIDSLTLSTGEDYALDILSDGTDLYAICAGDAVYDPVVAVKINIASFTRTSALTLDSDEWYFTYLGCAMLDGGFIYVGTYNSKIVKVQTSDMTRVGALAMYGGLSSLTVYGGSIFAVCPNVAPSRVDEILISTFTTTANAWRFGWGDGYLARGVGVLGTNFYVYTEQHSFMGGKLLKLDQVSLAVLGEYSLTEDIAYAFCVGPDGYIYITADWKLLRIDPTDMSLDASLTSSYGPIKALASDGATYLFGATDQGNVVAYSFASFVEVSSLATAESSLRGLTYGDDGNLYASAGLSPDKILKITPYPAWDGVDDLVLDTGENGVGWLAAVGGYTYVNTNAGEIVKIDQASMTRVGSLSPGGGMSSELLVHDGFLITRGSTINTVFVDLSTFTVSDTVASSSLFSEPAVLAVNAGTDTIFIAGPNYANGVAFARLEMYIGTPVSATLTIPLEALEQSVHSTHTLLTEAKSGLRVPFLTLGENWVNILHQISAAGIDTVLYPNNQDIDSAIAGEGSGEVRSRPALYRVDIRGQIIEDLSDRVISATVAGTRSEVVSRTAQIVVRNTDGLDLKTDYLMPAMIWDISGIDVVFPYGIFQGSVPRKTTTEKDRRVTLVCNDLSIHLTEKFSYPFTVPAGTNYRDALAAVWQLTKLKGNALNIPPINETLPNAFTWEPRGAFGVALNGLLQGVNFLPIYISKNDGAGLSRPREFLRDRAPDVTYTSDPLVDGTYLITGNFDEEDDNTEQKNEVIVEVNDPLRDQFWETYYIENALSPIVIPYRHGFTGFSATDYWEAAGLTAESLVDAADGTLSYPTFGVPGTVALGGWVWYDPTDTGRVMGGFWETTEAASSIVLMANGEGGKPAVGIVTNPTSNLASGTVTEWLESPYFPTEGWHRVSAVFSAGGHSGPNLLSNAGFESGDTAPGSNWNANTGTDRSFSFNADHSEGARSLEMTETTAYNTGAIVDQVVSLAAAIPAGSKIRCSFDRRVIASSSHRLLADVYVKYRYSDGSVGDWTLLKSNTENPLSVGSFETTTFISNDTTLDVVALKLTVHILNTSSATTGTVRIDNVKLSLGTRPSLTLFVDGVAVATSITPQAFLHAVNTNTFKIGGPGTGWDSGTPADDGTPARRVHDFGVWYGSASAETAESATQELALYNGLWPTNQPFCLAYWHLVATDVIPAVDHTSHGFTLSPVGSPTIEVIQDFLADVGIRDRFLAIPDPVRLPRSPNSAAAAVSARIFAEENASQIKKATLITTIDPRRDLNEVYRIRLIDAQGVIVTDDKWVVDGWSVELRAGGRMTHQIRRIEES